MPPEERLRVMGDDSSPDITGVGPIREGVRWKSMPPRPRSGEGAILGGDGKTFLLIFLGLGVEVSFLLAAGLLGTAVVIGSKSSISSRISMTLYFSANFLLASRGILD